MDLPLLYIWKLGMRNVGRNVAFSFDKSACKQNNRAGQLNDILGEVNKTNFTIGCITKTSLLLFVVVTKEVI